MTEPTDAELITRLNEPEYYHAGNFDTPQRAIALLLGLCQEAADALKKQGQPAQAAEPVAWAATSEDGVVEALGMNQSRRFDTPLYLAPQPVAREPLEPCMDNVEGINARLHFRRGWKAAEQAHGIKGGQHEST